MEQKTKDLLEGTYKKCFFCEKTRHKSLMLDYMNKKAINVCVDCFKEIQENILNKKTIDQLLNE